jgi:hypothetical protein
MPHCTSWNQILIKTFIIIEFGELKQRVIVGDDDPTFFTLANKQQDKDDGHCGLGEREKWLRVDSDIGWLDGAIW